MGHLMRGAVAVCLVLLAVGFCGGIPLAAQTPDEAMDTATPGEVSQNTVTAQQQEGWDKRSSSCIGRVVGVLSGVLLGPVGAVGGYFVGKYIDDMIVRKRVQELQGSRPNADSIKAWKDFIYRKYGVAQVDKDSDDYGTTASGTPVDKSASLWTKEQLELVNEVFKDLPVDFYKDKVQRIARAKKDGDNYGVVYGRQPTTVFLMDSAYQAGLPEAKRKALFQMTLIHEMTHNYQKSTAGKPVMDDYCRKFWTQTLSGKSAPAGGAAGFLKVSSDLDVFVRDQAMAFDETASPAMTPPEPVDCKTHMYPVGASVSQYGTRCYTYTDPWSKGADGSDGFIWGEEDMAETLALLFLNPELLKQDFPKRYGFLAPHFPSMAAGKARYKREDLTEPKSMFFAWSLFTTGEKFTIAAEHSPFIFTSYDKQLDWFVFPGLADGELGVGAPPAVSDTPKYLGWLKKAFQKGLPGPQDVNLKATATK